MRAKSNQHSTTMHGPRPAYSARQTFVGTTLVAVLLLAAVLAVTYPVAVVSVLVSAVVARRIGQLAHRIRQRRRREGRTHHVCIPMTNVCIEA